MYENLRRWFFTALDNVDVVFFGGDQFDEVLMMSETDASEMSSLIAEIRAEARARKIFIRVLAGTWKHDRFQNRFFLNEDLTRTKRLGEIETLYGEPLVKVYDHVTIDRIEHLNLSVLYIPGTLSCGDIGSRIPEIFKEHHLDQVDVIVTHTYYRHMLPSGIVMPPNVLDVDLMLPWVKSTILNGHVHTRTIDRRFVNTGSFDRIAHGEEEPKGFTLVDYDQSTETSTITFVENKTAHLFKTFYLSKFSSDPDTLKEQFKQWLVPLQQYIDQYQQPVHVRVKGTDRVLIQALSAYLTNTPMFCCKFEYEDAPIYREFKLDGGSSWQTFDLPVLTKELLPSQIKTYLEEIGVTMTIEEIKAILEVED